MNPLVWPVILAPATSMWFLKPLIQQGPPTFSGKSQKGAPSAGYWTATLSNIVVNKPARVLEFRALITELEGGLGTVMVGPCEAARAPKVTGGLRISHTPFSDKSFNSDGSGFEQGSIVLRAAAGAVAGAVQLSVEAIIDGPDAGSVTLPIDVIMAGTVRRGHYFSVGDHLHLITAVTEETGGILALAFLPPLRADVAAEDIVEMTRPRARMRLAKFDTGQLSLDLNRFGSPTIELEEAFDAVF